MKTDARLTHFYPADNKFTKTIKCIKGRAFIKNFGLVIVVSSLFVCEANCSRHSYSDQLTIGNLVTAKIMNDKVHTHSAELKDKQFVELSAEQRDVGVITNIQKV